MGGSWTRAGTWPGKRRRRPSEIAGRIRDKGLRHVSLCVADLAKAKVFALWINDVPSLVEELRGKGLEVLENKPDTAPFQQAFVKDPDGNMVGIW